MRRRTSLMFVRRLFAYTRRDVRALVSSLARSDGDMPTHDGRFNHLHTMLASGLVTRLGLPDAGVLDLAAVRSTSGGTLAAKLQEFGEATAAYDVERLSY